MRGGRPNDLPAVRYRAIAGANTNRWGFRPIVGRKSSRSVFGVKNIKRTKKAIRKEIGVEKETRKAQKEIDLQIEINSLFWESL